MITIEQGVKLVWHTLEDALCTYENEWYLEQNRIKDGKKTEEGFIYSSKNNDDYPTLLTMECSDTANTTASDNNSFRTKSTTLKLPRFKR